MKIDQGRFSEREKEVIALLLQGKSNKQIALALRIAQSTVEYHLKNIYQKLGVGSRTEAVLRLGKTTGKDTPGEVSESTSGAEDNHSGSDAQPISISNVPRSRTYWGIGLLVT